MINLAVSGGRDFAGGWQLSLFSNSFRAMFGTCLANLLKFNTKSASSDYIISVSGTAHGEPPAEPSFNNMPSFRLTNARFADGSPCCLGIKDGLLCRPEELPAVTPDYDCHGAVVAPGFMDIHVHLRDPGQTYKEDLMTATTAAAFGGFTTVLAMPNTVPAIDSDAAFQELRSRLPGAPVHVLQAGAITVGRQGLVPSDIPALAAAGFPALSDDGSTPQDREVMRSIMQAAAAVGLPVIDHCECTALSRPGVMHEGTVSRELGLPGQPREAELSIVRRDIELSAETGCRIHLQHLSTAEAVELLRAARKSGLPVSGEATPHHLLLTHEAVRKFGPNAKMAPPLREESDRHALLAAVADGTLSVIATDHAPHAAEEKSRGMQDAPFGIIGLEAAVPVCLTLLYHSGLMKLTDFIDRFTAGPAAVLGLTPPKLQPGQPADLTVFEPETACRIDVSSFHSKSRNCPYDGLDCHGKITQVFVGGCPKLPF